MPTAEQAVLPCVGHVLITAVRSTLVLAHPSERYYALGGDTAAPGHTTQTIREGG